MMGHVLGFLEAARVLEKAREQQLGHGVDKAGTADALGRHIAADDLKLDAVAELDALDRAHRRAHAAFDLAAFEGGTGGRCGGKRALGAAEDDLAVRPDVDEDADPVFARDARRQHAGHDVGADVRAERGQRLDVAVGMDLQADLARRDAELVHERGRKRRHGQRSWVDAEQQVQHRDVADDDCLVCLLRRDASLAIKLAEDRVHRADHRVLQLLDRLRSVHAVADTRDDVRPERRLAVEGRQHRRGHSGAQVHQRPDEGGRPDVKSDPVTLFRRVAGFHGDQLPAREHRGDAKAGLPEDRRQRSQHSDAGDHVVTFFGEGISQACYVAALVLHRWFAELEVHLAHVRVEDDEPAEAHRRGLRHPQQLRDLAGHVLVDPRLARQAPAVFYLGRAQLPVVGGFGVAASLDHTHLALAAGASSSARGVDRQTDPVRGAEHRGACRDTRRPVVGQVRDLELALDHCATLAAWSARKLAIQRIAYSS